jgi:hypothetical protein
MPWMFHDSAVSDLWHFDATRNWPFSFFAQALMTPLEGVVLGDPTATPGISTAPTTAAARSPAVNVPFMCPSLARSTYGSALRVTLVLGGTKSTLCYVPFGCNRNDRGNLIPRMQSL